MDRVARVPANATMDADWLSSLKMDLMKRRIVFSVIVLVLLAGVNCRKQVTSGSTRLGKFVDFGGCAHYVVQLLDVTAADSSILTKSWTDTSKHITYTNVFTVSDICSFAEATAGDTLKVGDEFNFTLNGPVPDETCYTCMIWPFGMPAASNSVTNIKLITSH
jgi:hypothetical protein